MHEQKLGDRGWGLKVADGQGVAFDRGQGKGRSFWGGQLHRTRVARGAWAGRMGGGVRFTWGQQGLHMGLPSTHLPDQVPCRLHS